MNASTSNPLLESVNAYIQVPTCENREKLIQTADDYQEAWIVDRASGDHLETKSRVPVPMYDRRLEVERIVDGIPIKLALQERIGGNIEKPWWTLSWRTKYSADSSNRRFYLTKDGCWVIPATIALEMINEMEELGGLDEEYFDQRGVSSSPPLVYSEMTDVARVTALEGVTGPDEDWGVNPYFVIIFDPDTQWKKVMIINRENDLATFRSITENPDYMPKKVLRPNAEWWLDNSMMDANVQQMQLFQSVLKQYPWYK